MSNAKRQVSVSMTNATIKRIEELAKEYEIPITICRPTIIAMAVKELHKKKIGSFKGKKK